jgi:hypothetical protein
MECGDAILILIGVAAFLGLFTAFLFMPWFTGGLIIGAVVMALLYPYLMGLRDRKESK